MEATLTRNAAAAREALDSVLRVADRLKAGATLADVAGYTPGQLRSLYQQACAAYELERYDEAMRIFAFLMGADHLEKNYAIGYGACLQLLGRHRDALQCYGMASRLDLTDPLPVMHSAECFLALGDRASARTALDYGLIQARAHAEHRSHVPRLEAMLHFLDNAQVKS